MTQSQNRGLFIFPSALGHCGITWTAEGVERFGLPHKNKTKALAALRRVAPEHEITIQPKPHIRKIVRRICRHMEGRSEDFRDIVLDLRNTSPFFKKVAAALRQVEAGTVVTYKELAAKAASPRAARAVGRCMAQNPIPLLIPCHRVIASDGGLGGFSAPEGIRLKAKILILEGIDIIDQKISTQT